MKTHRRRIIKQAKILALLALVVLVLLYIKMHTKRELMRSEIESKHISMTTRDFITMSNVQQNIFCIVTNSNGNNVGLFSDDSGHTNFLYISKCEGTREHFKDLSYEKWKTTRYIISAYDMDDEAVQSQYDILSEMKKPPKLLKENVLKTLILKNLGEDWEIYEYNPSIACIDNSIYLMQGIVPKGKNTIVDYETTNSKAYIYIDLESGEVFFSYDMYANIFESDMSNIKVLSSTSALSDNGLMHTHVYNKIFDKAYTLISMLGSDLPEEHAYLYDVFPKLNTYIGDSGACIYIYFSGRINEENLIKYISETPASFNLDSLRKNEDGNYGRFNTNNGEGIITQEDVDNLKTKLQNLR